MRTICLLMTLLSAAYMNAGEDAAEFDAWKARVTSTDEAIQDEAIRDWLNGFAARDTDAEKLLPLFLPLIESYAVKRNDEAMRGLMIDKLGRTLGRNAHRAIPILIKLATDARANFSLRGQAIGALGNLGRTDPVVIAAFIRILEDDKPLTSTGVHDRAIETLGKMGKAAESARPVIKKYLSHEFDMMQDAAYIALGRIAVEHLGEPLDTQIAKLGMTETLPLAESSAAFLAIEAAGLKKDPHASAARPAIERIFATQGNTPFQRAAIRTAIQIGPGSEPSMVRALVKVVVKDRTAHASDALMQVDPSNPAAIEPILEAFKAHWNSNNWTIPYYLSNALQLFGAEARPATPWLLKALRAIQVAPTRETASGSQAQSYLAVLRNIGSLEPDILPVVLEMLDPGFTLLKNSGTQSDGFRAQLYQALAAQHIPAEGALRETVLKRIQDGLESSSATIFACAAQLAGASKAAQFVPTLLRALDDKPVKRDHLYSELAAMKALRAMGPAAKPALPRIKEIAARPWPEATYGLRPYHETQLIKLAQEILATQEMQ